MEPTIPAALARAAQVYGDALAVAEPGGPRLSYRDLHDQAALVSRALIASGVGTGDRVAVWSPNTRHWVLAALGALAAGATIVPVSTRFTGPEALDVISRSRARVLFVAGWFLGVDRLAALRAAAAVAPGGEALPVVSGDIPALSGDAPVPPQGIATGSAGRVHPAVKKEENTPGPLGALCLVVRIPVEARPSGDGETAADGGAAADRETAANRGATGTVVDDGAEPGGWAAAKLDWDELAGRAAGVPAAEAAARAAKVAPDDISDILFTSGTTGRSKGAMSTHRQALSVARAWAECGGLTATDRYLVVNPFFHSFGYKAGILACLVSGAALVPQPVFDPGQAMGLIEAERITVLPGAPTIYQTILDHPDRGRYDLSSLRLAVTGAAPVPVALVERMRAELSFRSVLTAYGLTEAVVATMCRPGDAPETVARTSGRAAAGFEVRVTGPGGGTAGPGEPGEILLRGPNVMVGYLDDPAATAAAVDGAGWLHTGDVGRLDEAGYLAVTDRLTDMYVCGGFNVYPAEVEQVLARLDGVAGAAVIGVADDRLGEVGQAYVVPRPGRVLDADQVLAFCRARLAGYKLPRQVEFRGDLPRNSSGKVLKRQLREESR